jgi:hypothetical protein
MERPRRDYNINITGLAPGGAPAMKLNPACLTADDAKDTLPDPKEAPRCPFRRVVVKRGGAVIEVLVQLEEVLGICHSGAVEHWLAVRNDEGRRVLVGWSGAR